MLIQKSSNPALGKDVFDKEARLGKSSASMTVNGTVNKTFIMLALVVLSASYTWNLFFSGQSVTTLIFIGAIGGLVAALVTIFKKEWAATTAPIYAVLEGLFLGAISGFFESAYPGIVMQGVMLTLGTLFAMLFLYKTRIIKVTEKFKMMVFAATGGIAIVYLVSMVMGMFGAPMAIMHDSSPMSIGFSLLVVAVAALNLVMDFDFIENGAEAGAPKYMEWYGAFGIMVTLIWLYIEFLRLLSKLRN